MDTSVLHNALQTVKRIWNKLSKTSKYIVIITIFLPSCMLLVRELYWYFYRKYHSLPPGPNGLPLFGILFAWHRNSVPRINLSKKYGPIFFSTVLGIHLIVLSSSHLVKQIFPQKKFLNHETFFDPEKDYYHSMNTCGKSNAFSLVQINGESWKKRRKLSQDTLFKVLNRENTGNLLKNTMETEFVPYLDEIIKSNKAWHPRAIFQYITLNTIYSTLLGEKLDRNSAVFHQLQKDMEDSILNAGTDAMVTKLPFMKYFFAEKLDRIKHRRDQNILKLINKRINNKNETENLMLIIRMKW